MTVPLKVRRSTTAAQRRGSVKSLVQPPKDSLEARARQRWSGVDRWAGPAVGRCPWGLRDPPTQTRSRPWPADGRGDGRRLPRCRIRISPGLPSGQGAEQVVMAVTAHAGGFLHGHVSQRLQHALGLEDGHAPQSGGPMPGDPLGRRQRGPAGKRGPAPPVAACSPARKPPRWRGRRRVVRRGGVARRSDGRSGCGWSIWAGRPAGGRRSVQPAAGTHMPRPEPGHLSAQRPPAAHRYPAEQFDGLGGMEAFQVGP